MSRNLLPFLYQTRTLQFACRRPVSLLVAQKAGIITKNRRSKRPDNSIPFQWDDEEQAASHVTPEQEGTLTPTESEIFKSIFDEIAQGRLPKAKKRPEDAEEQAEQTPEKPARKTFGKEPSEGSLVDQARSAQSDTFLKQFPASLQHAAETALGLFKLQPARPKLRDLPELDKAEAKQMAVWARYQKIREEEIQRVEALMKACVTDAELWEVMEDEVFSLPYKLGIGFSDETPIKTQKKAAKRRTKGTAAKGTAVEGPAEEGLNEEAAAKETAEETTVEETAELGPLLKKGRCIMDVHGPLYTHYLSTGIKLLDTAFLKPSMLALNIIPRIKDLGLSSYVLGVSTPLFAKLADIHWKRYGDAAAALDALDEMKSVGLHPDEEVEKLVEEISSHLHSCTWGAQGPFVMAMMDSPPYDASLITRLERWERIIAKSRPRKPEPEPEPLEE
ncbi:hypothetical protein BHE90_001213 [Fusarium euwallaceae]|uniref:Mtf2-like C-terminal domain-containing protein n=1 Tax=Fusarium euwallaceae TaxID=1147111 RepID=A0A430M834_9HYPO|nr:hypothetical protein BHE90_001213 [Fusarium euwallaceae]